MEDENEMATESPGLVAGQSGAGGGYRHDSDIRVLFLGDEGVGKTSIIATIVTDTFPKDAQKMFRTVTISPDLYLLPDNNNAILVDSDASKGGE